jgi:MFS transporter, AAHS family, 4-hydroxybenzoate transporter
MEQRQSTDISEFIDNSTLRRFHFSLFALCGVCLILDGFDAQAISYAAPSIVHQWHISRASLGPVFGAGLFGMLCGSLFFSVLADKCGRRPVIIVATLFFSMFMLATAAANTLHGLLFFRFLTGLGMGAVIPTVMSLAGEYSPSRIRVTAMMIISCGFTVGAALGGALSAILIPLFGWQSIFLFGAAVPLLLAGLMFVTLPESLQFLMLRGKNLPQVGRLLRRIDPTHSTANDSSIVLTERPRKGFPVWHLFREERAKTTLLLWVINFMNLLDIFFLSSWLPTLLRDTGYTTSVAVLLGAALQAAGVVGTFAIGRLIERFGFLPVLASAFLGACVAIPLIGHLSPHLPYLALAIVTTGFCILGGQPALNALAAVYYPTALRTTGVGWSLAMGRVGSIVGPVLGGALVQLNLDITHLFLFAAIPCAIALVSSLAMQRTMQLPASRIKAIALGQ